MVFLSLVTVDTSVDVNYEARQNTLLSEVFYCERPEHPEYFVRSQVDDYTFPYDVFIPYSGTNYGLSFFDHS